MFHQFGEHPEDVVLFESASLVLCNLSVELEDAEAVLLPWAQCMPYVMHAL